MAGSSGSMLGILVAGVGQPPTARPTIVLKPLLLAKQVYLGHITLDVGRGRRTGAGAPWTYSKSPAVCLFRVQLSTHLQSHGRIRHFECVGFTACFTARRGRPSCEKPDPFRRGQSKLPVSRQGLSEKEARTRTLSPMDRLGSCSPGRFQVPR